MKQERIECLDDFYRSDYFEAWDAENRSCGGCGIILSDPERFDRIYEAAEDGGEGSTHREIIQDWRDALRYAPVSDTVKDKIEAEIDECEDWHIKNGSIDEVIG